MGVASYGQARACPGQAHVSFVQITQYSSTVLTIYGNITAVYKLRNARLAGSSVGEEGDEEEVAVPPSILVAVSLSLLVLGLSATLISCKCHLYSRFFLFSVLYNVCVFL